ncbi:hypothetical protein PYV02_01515 [Leifsonia sp. H3M29-4]|uniref:hypothetical protein n=1 Tax=Salinibacterium metalliresistens TaxID=3031321 RepID=UPI0023DAF24F|nr:hypothetical protein [Salinibacterium metalliresistens]MDF1477757.1 hypothetical protein [Salinibacterium metalliresistens]
MPSSTAVAELLVLVDLAHIYWCDQKPERHLPSAREGLVRIRYGTLLERKHTPHAPGEPPPIQQIEIYSSLFAPAKWVKFDDIDDAIKAARDWYEYAKSLAG